jgi:hypothetical protein
MAKKVWYKWPENYYGKDYIPWYLILRRLLAAPIQLLGFSLMYIGTLYGYGKEEADRFKKEFF